MKLETPASEEYIPDLEREAIPIAVRPGEAAGGDPVRAEDVEDAGEIATDLGKLESLRFCRIVVR